MLERQIEYFRDDDRIREEVAMWRSIFVPDQDLRRAIVALERAGVLIDREDAARSVARIAMFTG